MGLRERLRQYISYKNLNDSRFEKMVGLSNASISKMGDNTRRSTLDKISTQFPELNISWLLTGKGNMLTDGEHNNRKVDEDIETRPRIPLDATAGSLSLVSIPVRESECERLPVINRFPKYDFTIMVKGDSMEPEFHSGDEIACRFINQASFIQWGRPHILDTSQGIVLKRIYNNGDTLLCKSDNEAYHDFEIPKEDIYKIALVVGIVRVY